MATALFTKVIEDFHCCHCHAAVTGNGYTNHCPQCLWSLHVDTNPGDRAANCNGKMHPVGWSKKHNKIIIHHQCQSCGRIKKNKTVDADNLEALFQLKALV